MLSDSNIVRWGGWAGVVAALMFVLAGVLILLLAPPTGAFDSPSDYLIEVLLVAAFAGPLLAIGGLHALQSGRYGRLGAAGSSMAFVGYALIVVVTAVSALAGGQALHPVRLLAAAVLIGSALLGAATLRARVLPWWCGVLLIVGFPLGDISNAMVAEGSESIVFGILWGSVGYALLLRSRAHRPSNLHA